MPQEIIEISSEVTQESGETFDSQETISDYELCANVMIIKNLKSMQLNKDLNYLLVFMGNWIVCIHLIFRNLASRMCFLQIRTFSTVL